MSKRTNEHIKLSEGLKDFIANNKRLETGLDNLKINQAWHHLMGNGITNYTLGLTLKKSTLYIKLSSSVLREELSYGTSKIIAMLNEELGKDVISKIVFQ